ncbi:MAG: TIM barrel protein [Firmicutes bacterium]|nr:TIM barrel protein [Bacillota bacterium]
MEKIRFGPSGNDKAFYDEGLKRSLDAPKWLSQFGLTAYEYSFGHGARMSMETAAAIGEECRKYGIEPSAHAPYFINLANDEAYDKNYKWIRDSLVLLRAMGGRRLVVHLASQGQLDRDVALSNTAKNLKRVVEQLDAEGLSEFLLCAETMGKYREIGDYKEICEFCKIDPRIIPTVDFGHMNCLMQGELSRNPDKFAEVLDYIGNEIGEEKLKILHVHWAAVEYNEKGERKHHTLDAADWNFPFEPFRDYIKKKGMTPVIICESDSIMAQDAVRLMEIFNRD